MPRYQVLLPCFIDGHLRLPGEIVTSDAKPGKALRDLDAPPPEPAVKRGKPKPQDLANPTVTPTTVTPPQEG